MKQQLQFSNKLVKTGDAMQSLEMMGLARRAEAALIEAGFPSASLSIAVVEPGKIRVSGAVEGESTKTKVGEVLKGLKGVESIENQLAVVRYPGTPQHY